MVFIIVDIRRRIPGRNHFSLDCLPPDRSFQQSTANVHYKVSVGRESRSGEVARRVHGNRLRGFVCVCRDQLKFYLYYQRMVCHAEHTFLYSQLMMHILSQEPRGGATIRRLCQEVNKHAKSRCAL